VDGLNCWDQLGTIIAWESQDPELLAEHFLTVAAYNLQHPAQFMDDVLVGLRVAVVDYLEHGVTAQELRRRAAKVYEGSKRVLKREGERKPILHPWAMTIAAVYAPGPIGAAQRVRAWGKSIRAEMNQA